MSFNKLDHSVLGVIRPRFRLRTNLSIDDVKGVVASAVKSDASVEGGVKMDYFILKTPIAEQHFWSPELQVHLEKDEDSNKVILRCLIGPKQAVWSLFMFVYSAIAVITLFLGMYGLIQMQFDKPSNAVYVIPVGLFLLPTIYFFSKIGQKTGHDQMMHLVSFLYHVLDREGEVERVEA